MTGGQPAEGGPTVPHARRADRRRGRQAHRHRRRRGRAPAAEVGVAARRATLAYPRRPRRGAASLRDYDGPSVLIYDQVCATEKRRRRKRGIDGAGDAACRDQRGGVRELRRLLDAIRLHRDRAGGDRARPQAPHQSDALQRRSVLPERLLPQLRHRCRPAGRARRRSALAGAGGRIGRGAAAAACCRDRTPWRGLFAGIGGGGIVTSGAILAMAAHLEGRHVKHAGFHRPGAEERRGRRACADRRPIRTALDVVRIPLGTADLMLAADLAVGCRPGVLERNAPRRRGDRQSGPRRDRRVQARRRCCRSMRCCIGARSRRPPMPKASV